MNKAITKTKTQTKASPFARVYEDFANADPGSIDAKNNKIMVEGTHLVQIDSVRVKESQKYDAIYLIADFTILETNSAEIVVGKSYAWVHNMLEKFFGASNAKMFIAAASGLDPKSDEAKALGQDDLEEAVGENQPLAGCKVKLVTNPKVTESGRNITVHVWEPN